MPLTHYILIRRDLTTGAGCAQITHAAGESFADYCADRWLDDIPRGTVAVVLGVRSERALREWQRRFNDHGIPYRAIWENAGPYANQLTAIGCWPTDDRERIRKVVRHLMPLKQFEG